MRTQSIPNLSLGLIEEAFLSLIRESLRVYRHNIDRPRPPVAQGENLPAAAAVVMLVTGLDHHLCRLKYLRDISKHTPPLPYTPYFKWTFSDTLAFKLKRLLVYPKDTRLLRQSIEMTVCRDAVIHPRFHTITQSWPSDDFQASRVRAALPHGVTHWQKAMDNKMKRKELSKSLKLPLVPTWISYIDAVVCILVLHRLLNLLEWRYGNYASVHGITAIQKDTKNLFTDWNWERSYPREILDWTKAFFYSLSAPDQATVATRLGGNLKVYFQKKHRPISTKSHRKKLPKLQNYFQLRNTWKPDFLSKPPPI